MAAIFGVGAILFGVMGILFYLIIWSRFGDLDKASVLLGMDPSSANKLLLPTVLMYLSFAAGLAAIVCGIVSVCLDKASKRVVAGIVLGLASLVMLLLFWLWAVLREPGHYLKRLDVFDRL